MMFSQEYALLVEHKTQSYDVAKPKDNDLLGGRAQCYVSAAPIWS